MWLQSTLYIVAIICIQILISIPITSNLFFFHARIKSITTGRKQL